MEKKPPDKYRTIKCPLKSIIKDEDNISVLFDAMMRTHKIVIHTYQFLRLWVLNKYHNNIIIPTITEDVIRMAFKSLVQDSSGPKPKGSNLEIYNEFLQFYNSTYKRLGYKEKIDARNLSQILGYMTTDMITNIENNVKMHFTKYVRRFVNSSFKKQNNEIVKNTEKGKKTELRKQFNKELAELKDDLLSDTLTCNEKYHDWIKEHRNNIFPKEYKHSYEFDVQNNPQKYLKSMIYMCLEIEKLETKSFQFFPLRTDITPKYIPIDSKSLVELFIEQNKNSYLLDIENKKHKLWKKYFDLRQPIFTQNNYCFDYRISTDCMAVSIQLIYNDFVDKEKEKRKNMKNKRQEMKEICKDMTQKEKEDYKAKLADIKKEEKEQRKLELKKARDKKKEEFKKLSKDKKEKLKTKQKKELEEKKKNKYIEFPYLEDLNDDELTQLQKSEWVVSDPGKNSLLYMKNKKGVTLNYTNRTHIRRTKRLKYQQLNQNYKDKNGISKIENKLSDFSSKTCNYDKFKEFIKNKNQINNKLFDKYAKERFRKYKWYSYINRKRAETDLAKDIKNKFGKDCIMLIGDWSDRVNLHNRIKGHVSTPNLGLKRKLAEHIKIYNLNEFRTSCLNHKTEEKCENLWLPDKKGKMRKIHSVLTYQTENSRMACINRDENAVNNMVKIVRYYLKYKSRPEKFRKDYKFPEVIKDGNPCNSKSIASVKCRHALRSAITLSFDD